LKGKKGGKSVIEKSKPNRPFSHKQTGGSSGGKFVAKNCRMSARTNEKWGKKMGEGKKLNDNCQGTKIFGFLPDSY